ncbi:uncharacterized protein LOC106661311 isoform X2 [Cimex lectularius]|uniref:Uncharacterized protein n=1 Tax=Cimex lectularius TaxID=79782 RepID=A0A8I6R6V4_CIMLE|nr:uncharacterized protein LOC106661311 isoform X2 [Cimex lectularius]
MSTEYREHYEWAKKDLYTREGKNIGLHHPEPVNYLAAIEGWKPLKVEPESEEIMAERMKKEFGAYKSSLIQKRKSQDENVFLTSYQTTFKPEYNYRPSFSTYEKAAKMYAKEVDRDIEDESDIKGNSLDGREDRVEDRKGIYDLVKHEEQEIKPDTTTTKNQIQEVQEEILGADELAQAAIEMIKTDFSKGRTWNLCNLPLVDAEERYHRYREYLDKSSKKKIMLNKIYRC